MIGSAAADEDPDGANGADVELLAAVAAGDVTAFELLYGRFTLHAHRVARSICRDHGRAEEAVQEAFMAVWNLGHLYDPARGPVTAWLLAIVRHKALDAARRNDRHARRRADDGG